MTSIRGVVANYAALNGKPAAGGAFAFDFTTVEAYLATHDRFIVTVGRSVTEDATPMVAYVNHGRLLIDCPCGNGESVEPTWGVVCCFVCGRQFRHVTVPTRLDDVDALFTAREEHRRNFDPRTGETADDLREGRG